MPNADGLLDALEGASLTERGFRVDGRGLDSVLQTVPKDLKYAYDIAYSSATAVALLATALETSRRTDSIERFFGHRTGSTSGA